MQISPRKVSVNSKGFGVDFEEESFGIGDVSIIMSILRDKMYSDPIAIICQEIMANARDAHREVGIPERPIEVTLPTDDDPFFRVRDFGPGITRQRMRDIFTQYGNSTKRDTDEQTGGFGLGAKTPWAYDDYFFINTVTPEDDDTMTLRSYRAYIDETRVGKIALKDYAFAEDEEQGTEIVVPVKPKDFGSFCLATRRAGEWWDLAGFVAPTLINNKEQMAKWRDLSKLSLDKGLDWMLLDQWELPQEERHPLAVVDGFPYRLNLAALQIRPGQTFHADDYEHILGQSAVSWVLFFETGQLELAANREALDYSETTIQTVLGRIREALEDISSEVEKEILACTDLWEANSIYSRFMKRLNGLGAKVWHDAEWRGKKLHADTMRVDLDDVDADMQRIVYSEDRMTTSEPLMERFRNYRNFYFSIPAVLCVDDTVKDRIPTSRVWTAMVEAGVEEAYVIKIAKQGAYDSGSWSDHVKAAMTDMDKEFALLDMAPVMLSDVEPSKLPRKKRRQTTARKAKGENVEVVLSVKRVFLTPNSHYATIKPTDMDVSTLQGHFMYTYYNDFYLNTDKKRSVSSYVMDTLIKGSGLKEVWAVRGSQSDKIGDNLVPWADLLTEQVDKLLKDESLIQAWCEHDASAAQKHLRELELETHKTRPMFEATLPDDHVIIRYLHRMDDMNKRMETIAFFRTAMQVLRRKDFPERTSFLAAHTKQIRREYPLLIGLAAPAYTQQLYRGGQVNKAAVEYVQAVDSGCITPM